MLYPIKNKNGNGMYEVEAKTFVGAVVTVRANLCDADLCDANLCGANLSNANLRDANLCGANLRRANLCGANLTIIWQKYCCHLSWNNGIVEIRIGCECHNLSIWEREKEVIAGKNDRVWWDNHGKHIYAFLKQEAGRTTKY
jgi:hypothetical protein